MTDHRSPAQDNIDSLIVRARQYRQNGMHAEAVKILKLALNSRPDSVTLLQDLAESLILAGQDRETAIQLLRRCLELEPDSTEIRLKLAHALYQGGHLQDAIAEYERLLEAGNNETGTLVCLGGALCSANRFDRGLSMLEQALAKEPGNLEALFEKATALAAIGRLDSAMAAYRQIVSLDPGRLDACLQLALMGGIDIEDPLTTALENRLHTGYLTPDQHIFARFSLGRIHENAGNYARAFEHFKYGNRRMRQQLNYSTAAMSAFVDSWEQHYQNMDFMQENNAEPADEFPLFIVGMPRSGTSLAEQILANHPDIHAGGELTVLHVQLEKVLKDAYRTDLAAATAQLNATQCTQIATPVLEKLHKIAPSAKHLTDKLPHNFMMLGAIHRLFPAAKIIHCRREPLDTCLSCYTTFFRYGQEFTYDLNELGAFYRLYEKLMSLWHRVFPQGVILDISYEQLVTNTETTVRAMLKHCDLGWSDACLGGASHDKPVLTASMYQVRKPVYTTSIGRWQHYAPHLSELTTALGLKQPQD